MIKRISLALVACFVAVAAMAQSSSNEYTPFRPIPVGDVLLTLPSSHMPAVHTWEVKFSHRFNQSIDAGEAFHSLFGLDNGANVGLGLSYVPVRDLELSLLRSNVLDTYEVAGKYLFTQQSQAIPLSLAVRAGGDFRTEENVDDRTSVFAQVIASRQFANRVELFAMPTVVTDAGRATNGTASVALFEHAFNVPVGAVVQFSPGLSVVGEIIPPNRDLPDDQSVELGWAVGLKSAVGGHLFEVLLTNSNGMTLDQYVTSTYNGAPFSTGDIRLGFNIERRFGRGTRR